MIRWSVVTIAFALGLLLVVWLAVAEGDPKEQLGHGGHVPAERPVNVWAARPSTTTTTEAVARAQSIRPKPSSTSRPVALVDRAVWLRIADCESGDWDDTYPYGVVPGSARWDDRRGGYEGGLHFLNDTWLRAGGGRYTLHAYDATPDQQIEIAQAWLGRTSWNQWPVCSRKVGAR